MQHWRTLTGEDRTALSKQIGDMILDRLDYGVVEYGPDLQGDPLKHAIEEALDIIIYITWAQRQRDWREQNGNTARDSEASGGGCVRCDEDAKRRIHEHLESNIRKRSAKNGKRVNWKALFYRSSSRNRD